MTKKFRVARAKKLWRDFSGHAIERMQSVRVPDLPDVGVVVGDVDGIDYTTIRDGKIERYRHTFAAKDRPLFVVSDDGCQLLLIGGNYRFTDAGIVDASDRRFNRR